MALPDHNDDFQLLSMQEFDKMMVSFKGMLLAAGGVDALTFLWIFLGIDAHLPFQIRIPLLLIAAAATLMPIFSLYWSGAPIGEHCRLFILWLRDPQSSYRRYRDSQTTTS